MNQPGAEHDQAKIQQQQRHQERQHGHDVVEARSCDEHAEDGKRQGKHRDAGAQRRERRSFSDRSTWISPRIALSSCGGSLVSMRLSASDKVEISRKR